MKRRCWKKGCEEEVDVAVGGLCPQHDQELEELLRGS